MKQLRLAQLIVLVGIFIVGYLTLQAWKTDYMKAPEASEQSTVSDAPASNPGISQAATQPAANSDVPQVEAPSAQAPTPETLSAPSAAQDSVLVSTDVFEARIGLEGGDLVGLKLKNYPVSEGSTQPFTLFTDQDMVYVAQTGLAGTNGIDTAQGRALFRAAKSAFDLGEASALQVPLSYTDAQGRTITKTYTFERGSYVVKVDYEINNTSNEPWQGNLYAQLKRDGAKDPSSVNSGFMHMATYLGGAWGTQSEAYNKLKFKNFADAEDKLDLTTDNGWVAMVQHYFLSAFVVPSDTPAKLYSFTSGSDYIIGMNLPTLSVAAGQSGSVSATLWAGPKLQEKLDALNPSLDQTVDYGILWPIAKFLFIVLEKIHSVIGNWGWAIIVLTLLVKIAFFPISNKAYRSMAKMRIIAPKMQRMKEEFGDDRMRFSQEMMKLYQEEKVNPLSGCLPILIQMPVFLALYWVLVESVELRQAPWIGWITDLSTMDPYFILPIIMGVSMYLSQQLNPQPTDPTQAKVFKMLPIIFTVFMLFFPAGLVLYWTVNNLFTLGQQQLINRKIDAERAQKA